MNILIVKISSLGDIIQTFCAIDALCMHLPNAKITWVAEKKFCDILKSHPHVHEVIELHLSGFKQRLSWGALFSSFKKLREKKYDYLFDFQGNIKSAVFTAIARAKKKIGFSYSSVREWPNILATNVRYSFPEDGNIRSKHLSLVEQFFNIKLDEPRGVEFASIKKESKPFVMVCPGSKWKNKRLPLETFQDFLGRLQRKWGFSYLFVWGSVQEKQDCEQLQESVGGEVLEKRLSFVLLQSLMAQADLVIGVDSSALHLCGTTNTPSFSVFGPTRASVFKPLGSRHVAFQSPCPYGKTFVKQCPVLRECPTGACMSQISSEELAQFFDSSFLESQRSCKARFSR